MTPMPHPAVSMGPHVSELRPLLDQELDRLPAKYRTPLVLCDLESRSRKDVAAHLQIPEGTLSSRLAKARQMLAGRLSRRGVILSFTALAALLIQEAAIAVPPTLIQSTIQVATMVAAGGAVVPAAVSPQIAALVKGVMKNMFLAKIKIVIASITVAALLAVGAILVANQAFAEKRENPGRLEVATAVQRDGEAPKKPAEGGGDKGKAPKQEEITVTGKVIKQEVERKTDGGDVRKVTQYYLIETQGNKIQLPGPRVTEAGQVLDKFKLEDFVGKDVAITGRAIIARTETGASRVVRMVLIADVKQKK